MHFFEANVYFQDGTVFRGYAVNSKYIAITEDGNDGIRDFILVDGPFDASTPELLAVSLDQWVKENLRGCLPL
jgi:hypothetical protein